MSEPAPFHIWKQVMMKEHPVLMPREWYWEKYGHYCNQVKNKKWKVKEAK